MKTLLKIFFLSILSLNCYGQTVKTKQYIKTIIQQRSVYLNGGARASLGGKSRTTIKIDLPTNTKSWYYSFSTTPGESGTKNLNLALQLSSLALDPSGLTKSALSNVEVPSGSGSIDVYVFDQANSDLFLQKVDNNGGTFYFKREGTVANTKQAVVDIDDFIEGTFYIGLKNPSSFEGINIFIEVVALIEEIEEQTEEQSQAMTLGNLGWKAFERGDYDKCLEHSKKAIALDNTLGFVHFNIALAHLIKGDNSEAITAYTKAISIAKKSVVPKETLNGAIEDLKKYMDKFPSKNDAQDVLEILKEEYKNFQ